MMRIPLDGIRPDSLGGYLAGLGVLKALQQEDSDLEFRSAWRDGRLVLGAPDEYTIDRLVEFIAKKWQPTSFEKWWKDVQEASKKDRLAVPRARASEPDDRVDQLDAVMVESTHRVFNDLLGTGGNVGKRDLANVCQKSKDLTNRPQACDWLRHSLLGVGSVALPQLVGGGTWFVFSNKTFNSGQSWFREGQLSPWSFLLAMEGALLLRGAVHRRLGTLARGKAVFPFLSRPVEPQNGGQVAHGKAEFWAPLWQKFASLGEIEWVLRQGRAEIGGRPATAPHEFAVAALDAAVDEGVPTFARFELCQTTSAQVYEALPRERVHVAGGDTATLRHSRLLLPLIESGWIERLPWEPKRADQRGRFVGLRGPIEAAMIQVSEAPEDPERWRSLLLLLARTQHRIDRNRTLRGRCFPLPLLHHSWFDRSWPQPPTELRIARAIASLGCSSPNARLLANVFGIEGTGRQIRFPKARPARAVWHEGRPLDAILAVLRRRLADSDEMDLSPLHGSYQCPLSDIAAFLSECDAVDDELIATWVPALSLIDWKHAKRTIQRANSESSPLLHPLYTLVRPLCDPGGLTIDNRPLFPLDDRDSRRPHAAAIRTLVNLLLQGAVDAAIDLARRRYLAAGWRVFEPPIGEVSVDAERLTTALLIPAAPTELALRFADQWIIRSNRSRQGDVHAHA